jgi:hypothetical protein
MELNMIPVVPPKSNRREPWDYDRELYKKRNQSWPIPMLNTMIKDYCAQLAQVQKSQFHLGINEFKGPLYGMRGVIDKPTLPDDTQ